MSLIIKGMDMPKSCFDCRFYQNDMDYCEAIGTDYGFLEEVKLTDCPLVEIPAPHGDLIDRDAFLNDVDRVTYIDNYDYDSIHELCHDRANAAEVIIEAMEE